MDIRTMRADEWDAVGEVRLRTYRARNLLNADYADTLRNLGSDGHGEVFVAADGDGLAGTVMLEPWHAGSEVALSADEVEIRALAVAPEAQGRGVGRALVRWVCDRARERGARRIVLSTQPAMSEAHRLYYDEGFKRAPGRDFTPAPGVRLLGFELTVTG